jgi:hypothetical protein
MTLQIGPISSMGTPPAPAQSARDLAAEMLKIIQAENARGWEIRPATMQVGCDGNPNINALDGTPCNGDPNGPLVLVNPQTRSVFTAFVGRPFVGTQGLGTVDRTVLSACQKVQARLKTRRRFIDDLGNVYGPDGAWLTNGAPPASISLDYQYGLNVLSAGEKGGFSVYKNSTPTNIRQIAWYTGIFDRSMYSMSEAVPMGGGFPHSGTYFMHGGIARGEVLAGQEQMEGCIPYTRGIVVGLEFTGDPPPGGSSDYNQVFTTHALAVRDAETLQLYAKKFLGFGFGDAYSTNVGPSIGVAAHQFSVSSNKEGLFFIQQYNPIAAIKTYSGSHIVDEEYGVPNVKKVAIISVNPSNFEPSLLGQVTVDLQSGATILVATTVET